MDNLDKKTAFEKEVYSSLESNEYLTFLYDKLIFDYACSLFTSDFEKRISNQEISSLLRFADILSKSVGFPNSEMHNNLAQEIISLLSSLCNNSFTVNYVAGSVLTNIGNLRGLKLSNSTYIGSSFHEIVYHEIVKNTLRIPYEDNMFFLKTQKSVFDHIGNINFSYSGPTSMGKSFLIRQYIKSEINNGKIANFAIIVPTKALINEVSSTLILDLRDTLKSKNYRVITSAGALSLNNTHNFILVLTPERLLYLLLDHPNFPVSHLFIDEAHRLSSNDTRSPLYYKVLDILSKRGNVSMTFSSPYIPNPNIYLQSINSSNMEEKFSKVYRFSPVSQFKFLVDLETKSFHVFNNLSQKLNRLSEYENLFFDQFSATVKDTIDFFGGNSRNIVYVNSTNMAIELATQYAKQVQKKAVHPEVQELINDLRREVHADYYLIETLEKGVAYHIGYLPASIRERVEYLFKEGYIETIFCTSTLLEGVNLPADNLFITSHKNGRYNLSSIEFKNLIGRVGRIEYNLYGKVFLVNVPNARSSNIKQYKELLSAEPKAQELAPITALTSEQKREIVACLRLGKIQLPKTPSNQSQDNYESMRKYTNILLRDIMTDNMDSFIYRQFVTVFDNNDVDIIKEAFAKSDKKIDDDVNISVDQIDKLENSIRRGLTYPKQITWTSIMNFLDKLSSLFKWDVYEKGTLGKRSLRSWYAVILNQWMSGYGLGQIISKAISHKQSNQDSKIYINFDEVVYDDSKYHKNVVISDTLEVIDNIVLFKISNYFFKFSSQYKEMIGKDFLDNDWYEYVEYGTNNPLSIFLQRNGFSRDASTFIKQNQSRYIIFKDSRIYLRESIFTTTNSTLMSEIQEIKYNVPELFWNR